MLRHLVVLAALILAFSLPVGSRAESLQGEKDIPVRPPKECIEIVVVDGRIFIIDVCIGDIIAIL
ncbi:MAG: hypothetical protein KIT57_09255 [Blastocatellales bacterium]|nr:hypothetical protein [Blastocatellales bacterium]